MSNSRSLREERKANGLCTDCGSQAKAGVVRCEICLVKQAEARAKHYKKKNDVGLCSKCDLAAVPGNKRCQKHLEEQRAFAKTRHDRLRDEAFAAYGGYVCNCCSNDYKTVLELDHVHGGGNKHRASLHDNSTSVYKWLKDNNYPAGMMQVLCANCNKAKHREGVCNCKNFISTIPK